MSIFKDTFPEYVREQLKKRQEIVGNRSLTRLEGNNTIADKTAFLQWQNTKTSWVFLSSFTKLLLDEDRERFSNLFRRSFEEPYYPNNNSTRGIGEFTLELDPNNPEDIFFGLRGSFNEKYQNTSDRGYVPMPGIVDVSIQTKSAYGSLREANVNFVCYSKKQFNILEKLYMRPGHHVLIQWGWSKWIDPKENKVKDLLDDVFVTKTSQTSADINNRIIELKEKYYGCYDGFLGLVKNFNYEFDGYVYKCNITLIGKGEVLASIKMNNNSFFSEAIYTNIEDNRDISLSDLETYFIFGDYKTEDFEYSNLPLFFDNTPIDEDLESYLNTEIDEDENSFKAFIPKLRRFIETSRSNLNLKIKNSWASYESPFDISNIGYNDSNNIGNSRPWLQALNEIGSNLNKNNIETYYQWGHICDVLNLFCINTNTKGLSQLQTYDTINNTLEHHTFQPNRTYQLFDIITNNIGIPPKYNIKGALYVTDDITFDSRIERIFDDYKKVIRPIVYSDRSNNVIYAENILNTQGFINRDRSKNFFIKDIYFSKTFILNTLKKYKDNENNTINLNEFINTLWKEANVAFGNINEFTLNTENNLDYSRIIDLNQIDFPSNKIQDIFTFESTQIGKNNTNYPLKYFEGNGSILRDLKISSKIPSSLVSTIAVGAQNAGDANALGAVQFSQFNEDAIDVLYNPYSENERFKNNFDKQIENKLKRLIEGLTVKYRAYGESNESYYLIAYPFSYSRSDVSKIQDIITAGKVKNPARTIYLNGDFEFIIRDGDRSQSLNLPLSELIDICEYLINVRTKNLYETIETTREQGLKFYLDRNTNNRYYNSVIPLDLNITLDGISGIVIGNLFKINLEDLPESYNRNKKIAFVTIGESQKITQNNWITEIKGQFQFLDFIDNIDNIKSFNTRVTPQSKLPTNDDESPTEDDTKTVNANTSFPSNTSTNYEQIKNTKLTDNFGWEEFASKDGQGFSGGVISENEVIANIRILARQLEIIRAESDPLIINSGFRSLTHNNNVGGRSNSQHPYGKAADIRSNNLTARQLYDIINNLIDSNKILPGGLGIYNNFVHYDIRGYKTTWDHST